jgi:hypothetical protein
MTLAILTWPLFRATDSNGLPLAGGKLYAYAAGTSTPLALLAADGVTPLPHPVTLDANGQAAIRLQSRAYKLDLFDAQNVHQSLWPVDNVVDGSLIGGTAVAVATVASVNGAASLTAAALIPAGARVLTVSTKILTALGTSGGLTGFMVGDGGIADRWGVAAALTQNALTGCSDAPAAAQPHDSSLPLYTTATAVVLSALGGLFDSVGSVEVSVQYLLLPHRSA